MSSAQFCNTFGDDRAPVACLGLDTTITLRCRAVRRNYYLTLALVPTVTLLYLIRIEIEFYYRNLGTQSSTPVPRLRE